MTIVPDMSSNTGHMVISIKLNTGHATSDVVLAIFGKTVLPYISQPIVQLNQPQNQNNGCHIIILRIMVKVSVKPHKYVSG